MAASDRPHTTTAVFLEATETSMIEQRWSRQAVGRLHGVVIRLWRMPNIAAAIEMGCSPLDRIVRCL